MFLSMCCLFFSQTAAEVNAAAIDIAQGVAQEGGALVAGSVSPLSEISFHKGKEHSQNEFRKQMSMFKEKGVDFLLGEVRWKHLRLS